MKINIDKPNIKGEDLETVKKSLNLYLNNFSEAVRTMLSNIDNENLSEGLRKAISGTQSRADALTENVLNLELRMGSAKNSIDVGDGYLRLGISTQICFGTLNSQHTDFKKKFRQTPYVVFNCNSGTAVISSATATGFNLNVTPTSGSYIAIGSYV